MVVGYVVYFTAPSPVPPYCFVRPTSTLLLPKTTLPWVDQDGEVRGSPCLLVVSLPPMHTKKVWLYVTLYFFSSRQISSLM